MIKIDDNVPMTEGDKITVQNNTFDIAENVPLPTDQATHKMDPGLKKIVARYNAAYQRVYGVPATVHYTKPWLHIAGITNRVSRQRMLEMAKQLEYRAGD